MLIRPRIVTLYLTALLTGCSALNPFGWFETDNQDPPAALTNYTARLIPSVHWSRDTGAGSEGQYLRLVPALSQGRLLVADQNGRVEAVETRSGALVWSMETATPIAGGPDVSETRVLVGTRKAEVLALDAADGHLLWRSGVSSEVLSVPRIGEGIAVAHTVDGHLFGLNLETGQRLWTYDRGEPILTLRGSASPTLHGNSVIAGFSSGALVNLELRSGEPRWEVIVTTPRGRSDLERIVDIDADPVLNDGVIYVSSYQGEVAAVNEETGIVLWRRPIASHAGLAVDGRGLYLSDSASRVWGLDEHSGAAVWKQEQLLNRRLSAPAICEDYVLVGDLEGYVHWLARDDGEQLARTQIAHAPISAAPLVADGVAYVLADNGVLAAVTATPIETTH